MEFVIKSIMHHLKFFFMIYEQIKNSSLHFSQELTLITSIYKHREFSNKVFFSYFISFNIYGNFSQVVF